MRWFQLLLFGCCWFLRQLLSLLCSTLSFSLTTSLRTTCRGNWSRRNASWVPGFTCCLGEFMQVQTTAAATCSLGDMHRNAIKKTQDTCSFQHRWRQSKYCLPPTQTFKWVSHFFFTNIEIQFGVAVTESQSQHILQAPIDHATSLFTALACKQEAIRTPLM